MKNYQNKVKEEKIVVNYSFIVNKESKLLDFLLDNLKKQSRNNIKSILKNRCVLVDGVCCTQFDYLLTKKNVVQIVKSPVVKTNNNDSFKL